MMLLTARKRAFGSEQMAAGQVCWLGDLWRHAQPATLVDFRGSSLSDAGSIPAISTKYRLPKSSRLRKSMIPAMCPLSPERRLG